MKNNRSAICKSAKPSIILPAAGVITLTMALAACSPIQPSVELMGSACTPGVDSPVTDTGTGRTWVLDYPCDLQPGEEVTFILNLHGGGSNTAYQHAYFPAWELKEKYRLVVATPYSPAAVWRPEDDQYLQNIVTSVTEAVGADNIRAFWLAGHSQGGLTSRRLVCTEFFENKVDGFASLSGGRLGGAPQRSPNAGRPRQADAPPPSAPTTPPPATAATPPAEPACDFSHIYAIGEYEIVSLPDTSALAEKYNCSARVRRDDVVDTEPGKTYDSRSQNPGTREWGLLPRPGTAEVYEYPGCDDGRVIADVVRIDKGHTEGFEPNIMDTIVSLMVSASGGKIQRN
ncbi:MAG: alpha/beta hydrolase [Pseudohongiella sp.]|nr:alpha/beta hydrolase [Pseudohongiella sp.]